MYAHLDSSIYIYGQLHYEYIVFYFSNTSITKSTEFCIYVLLQQSVLGRIYNSQRLSKLHTLCYYNKYVPDSIHCVIGRKNYCSVNMHAPLT